MIDAAGRTIDYMRISITDRCNLRCRYCMPDGITQVAMSEILTYEEIKKICTLAEELGIRKIKITGGEPLVRKGCVDLIGMIKESGFHGILISISNPADIIADFLRKRLGLSRSQVFSTGTSLDSARLRRMLSEITGVSRHSIQAYCMGEHGDSQFIPVSHIQIGGIPVKEYLSIHPEYRDKMDFDKISAEDKVCGFHIVEGKGCTEFGIGAVLSNIARAVMHDEKRILPVSVLLEGEYGEQGVPAGVPCVIGKNGVEEILEISLTEKEKEQLHNSCNVIRGFVEKADQM